MDGTWLLFSGLFSLIGLAVSIYGRRQQLIAPTVIGIALMGYTYFVHTYLGLIGIGLLLLVVLIAGMRMETGI
jgi:hypothetical protein